MKPFLKPVIIFLIIIPSLSLLNCGNESKKTEEKKEKAPDQFDEINNLVWAAKKKKITFNSSEPSEVAQYILGDEISGMVKGDKSFLDSSLNLKTTVNFKEGKLSEIFYDFFFTEMDKAASKIKSDTEKLKDILDKEYGNTIDEYNIDEMQTYTWGGSGYEIRLETFDDGYTIALKGNKELVAGNPSPSIKQVVELCIPFIENIANNNIITDVSTPNDIEKYLAFNDGRLDAEFDDIRLSGSFSTNDDNTIKGVYYDFFFNDDKNIPRALADADMIFAEVKKRVGEPTTSNKFDNGSMDIWELKNGSIKLNSFNDGYSLTYESIKL